jgi:NAD(P)-dependent dehydrogenase (short-subunit alcohol dehydrogenase family)
LVIILRLDDLSTDHANVPIKKRHPSMKPITEQTILITGSTDGIGKLAALSLANQRAHVLIHGRNNGKVERIVKELSGITDNKSIEGFTADISSLNLVRRFAKEVLEKHEAIDVLINNAGVGFADPRYSEDGYELRFAVNYLAPFLLSHLLLPALQKAAPSRIVNVSSAGQSAVNFTDIMLEKSFNSVTAYNQSKLALIMFTIDLAEQLKNEKITVNSLHPGTYLDTNMVRDAGISPLGKPETGANAVVFLATAPQMKNVTGKYFNVRKEARPLEQAYDANARKKLKELSLRLTGLTEE